MSLAGVKQVDSLTKFAIVKRLGQRIEADREFREAILKEPQTTLNKYGIDLDAEEVRTIWDPQYRDKLTPTLEMVVKMQQEQKEIRQIQRVLLSNINNPNFDRWRQRQLSRLTSQLHPYYHDSVANVPVSFELSKGCSVGCWFCGVSAPKLADIFMYTTENAQLWQSVLTVVKDFIGEAAGVGFCYWATDALDNPDYEKFCLDFHDILGKFPQTTTAQPLKDVERVRKLLKLSISKGAFLNRFSIISLKIFNQVMEAFTPQELIDVDLVLQNPESTNVKAVTGRGREKLKAKQVDTTAEQTTIACVTGLLFSMVDKTVKLVSPTPACDRYPNGYITYAEYPFTDAEDLRRVLDKMIVKYMSSEVTSETPIQFRSDLEYQQLDNGFQLSTRFVKRKFTNFPLLKEVGEIISHQKLTADEIVEKLQDLGQEKADIYYTLNHLYQKGVLDEVLF